MECAFQWNVHLHCDSPIRDQGRGLWSHKPAPVWPWGYTFSFSFHQRLESASFLLSRNTSYLTALSSQRGQASWLPHSCVVSHLSYFTLNKVPYFTTPKLRIAVGVELAQMTTGPHCDLFSRSLFFSSASPGYLVPFSADQSSGRSAWIRGRGHKLHYLAKDDMQLQEE